LRLLRREEKAKGRAASRTPRTLHASHDPALIEPKRERAAALDASRDTPVQAPPGNVSMSRAGTC